MAGIPLFYEKTADNRTLSGLPVIGDNIMITTEQQINTEIEALKKIFPTVRLLSASEVGAIGENCPENKKSEVRCFDVWKRNSPCLNCVSYRALTEKKQFSKIERTRDGIFQVIADYREVDGKPCVLELIKTFDEKITVDYSDSTLDSDNDPITLNRYFEKAYIDVLTQTLTRRYYEEYLADEYMSGGVAMIDLDDFKLYNDLFGHDVGDAVLKLAASTMMKYIRKSDKIIRYGGDEFLIVMQGVKETELRRCLSEICAGTKEAVLGEYPEIKLSVSAGGVICSDETVKHAVIKADGLMYLAKKKKDCFITAEDEVREIAGEQMPKRELVLIVDDSELNREILSNILKNEYDLIEAKSGEEAVAQIEKYRSELSVVLLDLIMPGMSGFDVLDYMNAHDLMSHIPVITITGDESSESMRASYEKGVTDHITRPFDARIVYKRVSNTVKVYSKQKQLASEVAEKIREGEKARDLVVEILSRIVENPKNDYGGNHAGHIIVFTKLILQKLISKTDAYGIAEKDINVIATAAALHDIGKVYVSRKILDKKGKLTELERKAMQAHTFLGEETLNNIQDYADEPVMKYAKQICRSHHERFDGNGYPDGLVGDKIPISAQAVSICDVYDALVSERSYKPAYSHEKAVRLIQKGKCGVFNPLIAECFAECADEFRKIIEQKTLKEGFYK